MMMQGTLKHTPAIVFFSFILSLIMSPAFAQQATAPASSPSEASAQDSREGEELWGDFMHYIKMARPDLAAS